LRPQAQLIDFAALAAHGEPADQRNQRQNEEDGAEAGNQANHPGLERHFFGARHSHVVVDLRGSHRARRRRAAALCGAKLCRLVVDRQIAERVARIDRWQAGWARIEHI
jgi:hypothetical protein